MDYSYSGRGSEKAYIFCADVMLSFAGTWSRG